MVCNFPAKPKPGSGAALRPEPFDLEAWGGSAEEVGETALENLNILDRLKLDTLYVLQNDLMDKDF